MTSAQKQQQAIMTGAYKDYEKGMNSYAFFKMNSKTAGQDLVQDAFTKTWKYLVKGGKIELMRAFLYHVLNNLIVDEYRKRKTTSLDALLEVGFEPSEGGEFKKIFDAIDGKAAVLLIAYLPEKYQNIMRMKYVRDLSLKEMSILTGQTKNAIAVQLHRGLEKLKLIHGQKKIKVAPLLKLGV